MMQMKYDLEKIIKQSLENFYERRIAKLSGLKLKQALKKKKPVFIQGCWSRKS